MTRLLFPIVLLAASAAAQQVTPLQVPDKAQLRDAVYADVNGDGREDLVLATAEPERVLRIYLSKDGPRPFEGPADYLLSPVWKDAVAYAVGDVHPDPGSEVVLFSGKGVYAWRPRAPEKERAVKLTDCLFLWQLPYAHHLSAWPAGVVDVNGDGRVDLVIPEPDGYRVVLQDKPGHFAAARLLPLPDDPVGQQDDNLVSRIKRRVPRSRREIRMSLATRVTGESVRYTGPLLEIADDLPAPQLRDYDGDGDLDLLAQTEASLFVWLQGKDGFPETPAHVLKVPVTADRGRKLEVSYGAHVVDLDNNRRTDCVIFSGDQRSEDVRTQVQFFFQDGKEQLFGADGNPDQLLVLSGFAGQPRFQDVDGDGFLDLMAGAVRPDLLDSIRGSSHIDVELYVFLNKKGKFERRPDMIHRTKLQASGLRFSRRKVMARFFGDVTGDGIRDLLVRDEETRVRVMLTRRERGGLAIHPKPLWELRIAYNARLQIGPDRGPRKAPDLLILEPGQILHVRFP